MKNELKTTLNVNETLVSVMRVENADYISLTDLAKYANSKDPSFTIKNWLRRTTTINYIGLWEELNNPNFNLVEFDQIKTEYGVNSFSMSPKQWIKRTNAIGFISKGGRYSTGTFAHPDIAFEFASWLSPEFKLYLITEFERLKSSEAYQNKIEWKANRVLSKANYLIHTDAIKQFIIPNLTENQKKYVYASEADIINVALFGMTAKEWRDRNPELAKTGNIRDYADLLHLVILNNLEILNSQLIENGKSQSERLIQLNSAARNQLTVLQNNKSIKELEQMQIEVNKNNNLIENK